MKQFFIGKRIQQTVLLAVCIFLLNSCKKDFQPPHGPVVLVAGYESNGEVNIAKYWINGQEVLLSDGNHNATANSLVASGNNVYVAGTITDKKSTSSRAVLWKNNIEIKLSAITTLSSAKSVFVSGWDVYVAGDDSGAVYWKNGKEVRLEAVSENPYYYFPPDKHPSSANSIFLSGNDVYVAGADGRNAVYWKNGVETTLTSGGPYSSVRSNSICVTSNDVYVAVTATSKYPWLSAYCFKNGTAIWTKLGSCTQIFVAGSNAYISGELSDGIMLGNAVYWKDGIAVELTSDPPPTTFIPPAGANSIYVSGANVYASGFHFNGTSNAAVYWKNGVETPLTNGTNNAIATSIFVR